MGKVEQIALLSTLMQVVKCGGPIFRVGIICLPRQLRYGSGSPVPPVFTMYLHMGRKRQISTMLHEHWIAKHHSSFGVL